MHSLCIPFAHPLQKIKSMEIACIGNIELLKLPKVAFLSSKTISSEVTLRCYDWATEMRDKGVSVESGFHSKVEKEVLVFYLKANDSPK